MLKFVRLFAVTFIVFIATHFTRSGESLASVIINENNNEFDFYQNITAKLYIAETSADFKIDSKELHDQDIVNFTPIKANLLALPYSSKTRWIKFTFKNDAPLGINNYILFDSSITGTIYVVDENAKLIDTIGSSIPGLNYSQKFNMTYYPISLAPKETKTIFWALKTRHNVSGEFALVKNPYYTNNDQDLFFMFYLGGIFVLVFFNILAYIFNREKFHFFYLVYVLVFFLFIINLRGKLDQWIYNPYFTFTHYLVIFTSILILSNVFFIHQFLSIKIKSKSQSFTYRAIFIYFLSMIALNLSPIYDWLKPYSGYAIDFGIIFSCFYMTWLAIKTLKENKLYSIIYLLSWSFVFYGIIIWYGLKWGYLEKNIITDNIVLIASLLEVSTLTLGIIIRQLDWQKERSLISQKASEKEKFERLLRVLTHDLANPLTLILANTKRLLVRDELTFQHPSLEKIYLGAENMKKVLTKVREEELLNLAPSNTSRSNIVESINHSLIFFEEQLQKKHLSVELNLNKEINLDIDRTVLVNNIFNNIISNAIKFSHNGGKIKITALTTNKEIVVEFRDYGVGLSKETLDALENSEDVQSTKGTSNEAGSGFGLKLIRDYMTKFGGSVEIISHRINQDQSDQGTTIRLIFPKVSK